MDISFAILEILLSVFLFFMSVRLKKYPTPKGRVLFFVPVAVALIMLGFVGFNLIMAGLYLASSLLCLSLFTEKINVRRGIALAAFLLSLSSLLMMKFSKNYKRYSISEDFENVYHTMKEHYVLSEEKGIDFDGLYLKYQPLFKEADKKQDLTLNYQLWQQFSQEFYDGHVGYAPGNMKDKEVSRIICESYGNDYGLSIIKLSSGEFVAVNVEGSKASYSIKSLEEGNYLEDEETKLFNDARLEFKTKNSDNDRLSLLNAGIKNGTVITKWDGKNIEDYYDDIKYYFFQVPVDENEEFYKPMYVAGMGGDSVEISFIDEEGKEKTVTVNKLGAYAPRLYNTLMTIDKGLKINNLGWEALNEETVVLRIYQMAYDMKTYAGTDYSEMTDKLRSELLAYKDAGYKNIIIDLRSNTGGSPFMVRGVACLFAPEGKHLAYYSAKINENTATYERGEDKRFIIGEEAVSYEGEDLWHDGNITLLVNAQTVSAGDDMVYMMGEYPNVKIKGITKSNNSCQAVQAMDISTGSFSFSVVPNLTPEGDIAIDTLKDHKARVDFDEYIPVTKEMVRAIFDYGEDYILQQVD